MSSNKKRKSTSATIPDSTKAETTIRGSDDAETIAEKLLSLLPSATTDRTHKDAKKLNRAFNLFNAQLQHRSKVLARNATAAGAKEPLLIAGVSLPQDVFQKVLKFLPQNDVGWTVPLVSKVWLSGSRVPSVWGSLEIKNGYGSNNKLNMTDYLSILEQPQFSQVKHLTLPMKIKCGKAGLKKLAAACPLIESLDFLKVYPDDAQLMDCVKYFPHLTGIAVNLWKATSGGVVEFCKAVGSQLQGLFLEGSTIGSTIGSYASGYLHDRDLQTIAEHCPNLKAFGYHIFPGNLKYYEENLDGGTHEGLIRLVQGCAGLHTLNLDNMPKLGLEFFQYLNEEQHGLHTLHASRLQCLRNPQGSALAVQLADKIPNLTVDETGPASYRTCPSGFFRSRSDMTE